MINFYFVRHGEKEAIPFDPPLTKIGQQQAKKTAEKLRNIEFKAIFSSPKKRTRQTSEQIGKIHKIPVIFDERLVERLEWLEEEKFDEFVNRWNETDLDRSLTPTNGMSSSKNGERMKLFINEVSNKYLNGNILVVTHGGTIGDLLRNLFGEENIEHVVDNRSGTRFIKLKECSITKIIFDEEKFELECLGDISHLLD